MTTPSPIVPPQLPLRFLRWFCDPDLLEDVEGDLNELYQRRMSVNPTKARRLYYRDVMLLFRPGIIRNVTFSFTNPSDMLQHHLLTALRHALRYKGYTLLNLLGLIVGITASILLLLWIRDEVSMDQFHTKSDRIYQVWRNMYQSSGEVITTQAIPQPLAFVLDNEYPEIEAVTVLSWSMPLLFRHEEEFSYESGRFASPEFFRIFSFPILLGNPETVLQNPQGVLISESLALKYFGTHWRTEVLDQTFQIDDTQTFAVTGVFQDPGIHSSLQFDWLLPADYFIQQNEWMESWHNGGFNIYFTLRQDADIAAVQSKVTHEINEHTNFAADERLYLQKFAENYLYSTFENGIPTEGRLQYVKILSMVALFILLIACVNYMNLATARAGKRSKEIGLRKTLGAAKRSLSLQFFTESFLLAFLSVIAALLAAKLALPFFNHITGKSLTLDLFHPHVWMGMAGITILTGFLAGSYPALLIPSFPVVNALKGTIKHSEASQLFRNGLVIFQFALSMLLIIGTLVISQQIYYILHKHLGLDKENLIYVDLSGELSRQADSYKTQLQQIPEVKQVTFTSGNPLDYHRSTGSADWQGKDPNESVEINVLNVDTDFFETMGVELLQGRAFSEFMTTDTSHYIINEVTADLIGFDDPIGQDFSIWGNQGKIIGMVRNFHMSSLYEPFEPLVLRYDPRSTSVAFIRTQHNVQAALQGVEKITKKMNPAYPFQYNFLDQTYENTYRNEIALGTLVKIFAAVSMFIACLGLLGLSSYAADQRSKEISVRKVHGAHVLQLMMMLCRKYALLLGIAFVIAAPTAYYCTQQWLDNFVFRIHPDPALFLLAGVMAFLIGMLTISFKSYQAANVNPVQKLRNE